MLFACLCFELVSNLPSQRLIGPLLMSTVYLFQILFHFTQQQQHCHSNCIIFNLWFCRKIAVMASLVVCVPIACSVAVAVVIAHSHWCCRGSSTRQLQIASYTLLLSHSSHIRYRNCILTLY